MTTICILSNSREDDAFLKHPLRPDKVESFLTDKNLTFGWTGELVSLTHFKGGLNPDRLQGGLSSEDLLVPLNPSGHLLLLSTPPPAMPALLLSSYNPGANPGPACPGLSLSCFPWIHPKVTKPPLPQPPLFPPASP